jgi:hypothetical protein
LPRSRTQLRKLGRPFVVLALAAMVGTALLDIVEDHHILALLGVAEADHPIDEGAIAFQQVLSQTKFSVSYLALFLFGLAVPADGKLAWVLKAFLTAGTLLTAVMGYAASPAGRQSLESTRWVGFLAGFAHQYVFALEHFGNWLGAGPISHESVEEFVSHRETDACATAGPGRDPGATAVPSTTRAGNVNVPRSRRLCTIVKPPRVHKISFT